jgi:hypothetical protein
MLRRRRRSDCPEDWDESDWERFEKQIAAPNLTGATHLGTTRSATSTSVGVDRELGATGKLLKLFGLK